MKFKFLKLAITQHTKNPEPPVIVDFIRSQGIADFVATGKFIYRQLISLIGLCTFISPVRDTEYYNDGHNQSFIHNLSIT
jgi:hypothetical protein